MEIKHAKAIEQAAQDHYFEINLREDYSGRAMYGETTAGLVGDFGEIMACAVLVAFELGEEGDDQGLEELTEDLRNLRTDNMGMSMIIY